MAPSDKFNHPKDKSQEKTRETSVLILQKNVVIFERLLITDTIYDEKQIPEVSYPGRNRGDLIGSRPEKFEELKAIMKEAHVPNPDFPILREEFR